MKYCPTNGCTTIWSMDNENFCHDCGVQLAPEILCLCGQESFSRKRPPKFCAKCGAAVTDAYLDQCANGRLPRPVCSRRIAGEPTAQ